MQVSGEAPTPLKKNKPQIRSRCRRSIVNITFVKVLLLYCCGRSENVAFNIPDKNVTSVKSCIYYSGKVILKVALIIPETKTTFIASAKQNKYYFTTLGTE